MDQFLKFCEDLGCEVEVGCKEKRRKKIILDSLRKLKGDDIKYDYVKKLYRYYTTINSLGFITKPEKIPVEEDKYGIHYLFNYLEGIVETGKWVIAGVIEALGKDEPSDPFCKYLVYSYVYTKTSKRDRA